MPSTGTTSCGFSTAPSMCAVVLAVASTNQLASTSAASCFACSSSVVAAGTGNANRARDAVDLLERRAVIEPGLRTDNLCAFELAGPRIDRQPARRIGAL